MGRGSAYPKVRTDHVLEYISLRNTTDSPSDCPLVTSPLLLLSQVLLTIGLLRIFIALAAVQVYLFLLCLSLRSVIFPPVPHVSQDSLPH